MLTDAGLSTDAVAGFQTAAERFGLPFIPMAQERYFLATQKATME